MVKKRVVSMAGELDPHNADAEADLLSALLLAGESGINLAVDFGDLPLRPSDFYLEKHQVIWRAAIRLQGYPNYTALVDALEADGKLDLAGGESYLVGLIARAGSEALAEQNAYMIRRYALRRQLMGLTGDLAKCLADDDLDGYATLADRASREAGSGDGRAVRVGTVSAADLLAREYPDIPPLIPDLLTTGLTILGGRPKLGKSFLALQMACAVGTGGKVLNREARLGRVLYIALEDSERSIRKRMQAQRWPADALVDFLFADTFRREIGDLAQGGTRRLARMMEAGCYALTVVDTLSRSVSGDQNDVASMTAALGPVQEVATKLDAAIALVDHHNKMATDDPIRDILGSTGKAAVLDTALGLYRKTGEKTAKLSTESRLMEGQTLEIRFDGLTCSWQFDKVAGDIKMTDNRTYLYQTLMEVGPVRCTDLADAVGRERGSVYKDLQEMYRAGRVNKLDGDLYAVQSSSSTTTTTTTHYDND